MIENTVATLLENAIHHHQKGELQQAEKGYREILAQMPKHPDAHHNLGLIAVQVGFLEQALPHLQQALYINFNHRQYWMSYLNVLIKLNKIDHVIKTLTLSKKSQLPHNFFENIYRQLSNTISLDLVVSFREAGEYEAAAIGIHIWLMQYPEDAQAYALQSQIAWLMQDEQTAKNAILKAQTINSTLPLVIKNYARFLLREKNFDEAWAIIQAYLQQQENDLEALLIRASLMASMGKTGAARTQVQKIIKQKNDYAEALAINSQLNFDLKDYNEALKYADLSLAIKPHLFQAWYIKGEIYFLLKKYNEASQAFEKLLTYDAKHIDTLARLGDIERIEKKYESAELRFITALQVNPNSIPNLLNYGVLCQEQNRLTDAVKIYQKVLSLEPEKPEVLVNLAWLLLEERKLELATEYMKKAFALCPDQAIAMTGLLTALLLNEKFVEAEKLIHDEYEKFASDERFMALCLAVALQKKDWVNAKKYFNQMLALLPNDPRPFLEYLPALTFENKGEQSLEMLQRLMQCFSDKSKRSDQTEMIALMPIGRAGSMFFHSLVDGHPQIATLPGVYFKGWFGQDVWKRFAPDLEDKNWRSKLADLILVDFEPLFDANSKKNVIGKPFTNTQYLAQASGFTEMGPNRDEILVLNKDAFKKALIDLLQPVNSLTQSQCFDFIHSAFEISIRGKSKEQVFSNQKIFYHIHNPNSFELANFIQQYKQVKLLYLVRQPTQSLESHMLGELGLIEKMLYKIQDPQQRSASELGIRLSCWARAIRNASTLFEQLRSPWNLFKGIEAKGIRLEDVKRSPKKLMPILSQWWGVEDNESLYQSTFCDSLYWGPFSHVTGSITGFDTKSVDRKIGALFGQKDIEIFEILFWPFSNLYGYTDIDEHDFKERLSIIGPLINQPFEFEKKLYATLPAQELKLEELQPYIQFHKLIDEFWKVLHRDQTLVGLPTPLVLF